MFYFASPIKKYKDLFYSIICRFPFFAAATINYGVGAGNRIRRTSTNCILSFTYLSDLALSSSIPFPPLVPDCEMFATLLSIALFALPVLQGVNAEFSVATPKSLTAVSNILTA